MIAVHNVTEDDTQELDDYEVRLNGRVLAEFQHKRGPNGLARCLRDAADALDKKQDEQYHRLMETLGVKK